MSNIKFILASACLIAVFQEIYGHGKMLDPVSRSYASEKGFNVPRNVNAHEVFCGGAGVQHQSNGGRCGACGDSYSDPVPRNNENGGKYGTGQIVKRYSQGQRATVQINLSANHKGHFEFAVCPINGNEAETDECFARYPVQLATGGTKYEVQSGINSFNIDVILPQGLTCQHCSFRWHYRGGNNWGNCEDGTGRLGCGPQETFRNCADITIS